MAINTNFYTTINELVNNGLSGEIGSYPITDYSTFVQTGYALNDLDGGALANNFVKNLMNKTALTISTFRSYEGRYSDIFRGTLDNGNTVELVVQGFYEAREPQFANLIDGQTVDQYKVALPQVHTKYYTDSNAYQIPVTISRTQIRKAWESPAAMDSFIQSIIGSVLNSNEMKRQIGRQAAVTNAIAIAMGADPTTMTCTTEPVTGVCLASLNTDNPLNNATPKGVDDYVAEHFYRDGDKLRSAVAKIRSTLHKMGEYSERYNPEGVATFTPDSGKRLYLLDDFAKACDAYIYQGAFNPEYNRLVDYVDISYWKNSEYPSICLESLSKGSYHNYVVPDLLSQNAYAIIALAFDEYAIMEYLKQQTMDVTPLNAAGQYWNYYLNVDAQLINNLMANCVPFYVVVTTHEY